MKYQFGFRFSRAGPKSYQTSLNSAAALYDLGRVCPLTQIVVGCWRSFITRKRIRSDSVMNSLRSVSISRRLWLILIVAVVMLLTLGVLMLKQIHDDLYHAKAQKTQHVVQTASGLLTYYHDLETAGTLTRRGGAETGADGDSWPALRPERLFLDQRPHARDGHAPDQPQTRRPEPLGDPRPGRFCGVQRNGRHRQGQRRRHGRLPLAETGRQRAGGQDLLRQTVRAVGLGARLRRLRR